MHAAISTLAHCARAQRHLRPDQRQHRRVGRMEEKDAEREDRQRALAEQRGPFPPAPRRPGRVEAAVGADGIDLVCREFASAPHRRDGQRRGGEEYRLRRDEIAARRPSRRGEPVADGANRALRPRRGPIAAWPTSPSVMAAMAGPSTALEATCAALPPGCRQTVGSSAISSALMPTPITAAVAALRLESAPDPPTSRPAAG